MAIKLSDIIQKVREQMIGSVKECAEAGIKLLPPKAVTLEVGFCHHDNKGVRELRIADFNDVPVARAHIQIEIYGDPAEYTKALNDALEEATDPFPGAKTAPEAKVVDTKVLDAGAKPAK